MVKNCHRTSPQDIAKSWLSTTQPDILRSSCCYEGNMHLCIMKSFALTCEIFTEFMLHFECPLVSLFGLFFSHPSVHFPTREKKKQKKTYKNPSHPKLPQSETYMIDSTDFGLMNTAMGKSCATCNRLIALPDTSKMQCLPFSATSRTDATEVPYRLSLYWPASMNRWFWMSFSICSRDATK